MAISLFQLSATAWLNPKIVGHAVQGTRNSQLRELTIWSHHLPNSMRAAGFDLRRVSRVGQVVQNLSDATESGNYQKAYRAKEKLARLTLGVRDDEDKVKWQRVARHSCWEGGGSIQAPVEQCRTNPVITANYDALSFVQKMAIFAVVQELYEQKVGQLLNRVDLESAWHCEVAVAQTLGIPIDLRVFTEHCIIDRNKDRNKFVFRAEPYPPSTPYSILSYLMRMKRGLLTRVDDPTERLPFVTDALIARVGKVIFQRNKDQWALFADRMREFPTEQELTAAVELLEAGFSLDKDLFLKYASTPNRQQRLGEAREIRARELTKGAELGDMTDPFEVIAALPVLGKVNYLFTALRLVREVEIPNRSEGVYYKPFSFSVQLVKPFYDVANKGTLEELKEMALESGSLEGLKNVILNFIGSRAARQHIAPLLQRVTTLSDESVYVEEVFIEDVEGFYMGDVDRTLGLVEKILKYLKGWVEGKAEELVRSGRESDIDEAEVKACHEIEKYILKLLITLTYWSQHNEDKMIELFRFDKRTATDEETYAALDFLSEFYGVHLAAVEKTLLGGLFPSLPSLYAILRELEAMNERKRHTIGKTVEVTMLPGIRKLDAFYGYMSENCLATESCAIYGMSDPDFVPYRILVDGEWRGVVQTFTKNVMVDGKKKKILIVTGVDPQRNLTPSPEEFLNGLEEGFWEVAQEGGYDLVVFPALDFAQSSRRTLLRTAFKRYRERIQIDEPVGFPRVGKNPDGAPRYYHDVQHRDFLVFRSPASP